MGTIKDRNGMDLTEGKDIKKWQDYTETESESESCSVGSDFVTLWTTESMEFSRPEY